MMIESVKDYLNKYTLFPLMGVPEMTASVASQLDELMKVLYGDRAIGPLVSKYLDETSEVLVDETKDPTIIAKSVYLLYQDKWNSLVNFTKLEYKPTISSHSTTTKTYGAKTVGTTGTDTTDKKTGIAGFNSSDYVDDTNGQDKVTYGNTVKESHDGSDSVVTEGYTDSPSQLEYYDLAFWEKFGLAKTLLDDAANSIALRLYTFYDI